MPIRKDVSSSSHINQTYVLRNGEREAFDWPYARYRASMEAKHVNPQTIEAMVISTTVTGSFLYHVGTKGPHATKVGSGLNSFMMYIEIKVGAAVIWR